MILIRVPLPDEDRDDGDLRRPDLGDCVSDRTGKVMRSSADDDARIACSFLPMIRQGVGGISRRSAGQTSRENHRTAVWFGWYSRLPEKTISIGSFQYSGSGR